MGSRPFCDRCNEDVLTLRDLHLVSIVCEETGKPSMPPVEVCPHCKEEVRAFIGRRPVTGEQKG